MSERLTWGGALAYGVVAASVGVESVRMIRHDAYWTDGRVWAAFCLVATVILTALLTAVAAISRLPLIADDGPWLSRNGWMVVIGLTVCSFLALRGVADQESAVYLTGPAVFLPFWVRRLEESYREGVEEARQAARVAREQAASDQRTA
ncbi:MAG: hypothetical protein QOF10_209 [Kribbellaceae bacterium]|jgi:hypothetical protein|nr:hypothetical protein [Kribbellaceae bacterium]